MVDASEYFGTLDLECKKRIRRLVYTLEEHRPRVPRATLDTCPQVVKDNLPCTLYLLGQDVPLPKTPEDRDWIVQWKVWMKQNEQQVQELVVAMAINHRFRETTVESTFAAKEYISQCLLPIFTKKWWDFLRAWAGLPQWSASSNQFCP